MLNNLKIRTRLLGLLAILLTLMAVVGGIGLYVAHDENEAMRTIYNGRVIPIVQLGVVRTANLNNRIAVTTGIIMPEKAQEQLGKMRANIALIDKNLGAYMATFMYEDEKALASKFAEQHARFVEEGIKPAMAAMQEGNAEVLKKIYASSVRPLSHPLSETLGELIELQARETSKLYEDGMAKFATARTILIFLILISAVSGIALGASIISGVTRSTGAMRDTMMRAAADGDLTRTVAITGDDEVAQTAKAFNTLIESFRQTIRQVHGSADSVLATVTQLAASAAQITQGSQVQSEAAASTAAAVEEITVSINSVAVNAEEVRKASEQSLQQALHGNESVTVMMAEIDNVQEAVNQIASSVKEFVDSTRAIAGMTQQVKDIADQTNLLALNAAIEAARAGEQGRGFAVVADEVRKLAEKSAQSANAIDRVTSVLNLKSTHVEATVQTGLRSLQTTQQQVETVAEVLAGTGDAVRLSSGGVHDIAASVSEQSLASTEIARNVEKIAQMSEENHAAVDSNSKEIVHLENLARALQSAAGRFKT